MILFLYGPDTYRSLEKLREIGERYKKVHHTGMSLHEFHGDDAGFDDIKNAIEAVPMFGEKKLIVLKHVLKQKDFQERFLEWRRGEALARSANVICVFFEEDVGKKSPIAAWLLKNSKSEYFELLHGAQLQRWCERFVQKRGIAIEGAALRRLLSSTGGDLWAFTNEIEKLHAYAQSIRQKQGEKAAIREKDIEVFMRASLPAHIFSFVDAFVEGNKGKALRLLYGHLESGDDPHYLFAMIHRQFKNITQARDLLKMGERDISSIAKTLGLHPYVAKKSIGYGRAFDEAKMKSVYKNLVQFDYGVKTGAIEPRAGLENLLLFET